MGGGGGTIYIYICIYVNVYAYVHVHVHVYVYVYVYVFVFVFVYVYVYVCICVYVYGTDYRNTYLCMHMYICTSLCFYRFRRFRFSCFFMCLCGNIITPAIASNHEFCCFLAVSACFWFMRLHTLAIRRGTWPCSVLQLSAAQPASRPATCRQADKQHWHRQPEQH